MKDVVGSPGTWGGLVLRVAQCICAAASVAAIVTATSTSFIVLLYFFCVIALQTIWSFILACVDIYALMVNADIHVPCLVRLFLVGDWTMATNSFAAASASAGVVVFLTGDTHCGTEDIWNLFGLYNSFIFLAFATWSFSAASAASAFWVLASLD
ncbi:hypothetical protein EJB05_15072, partial [Eragrostis curvula]